MHRKDRIFVVVASFIYYIFIYFFYQKIKNKIKIQVKRMLTFKLLSNIPLPHCSL